MQVYVWWFIAKPEEAAAIRTIVTTKARKFEEWPHLVVPSVDGPDMNRLERIIRGKHAPGSSPIGGVILDKSKLTATPFTAVSQMNAEYLEGLRSLDKASLKTAARKWSEAIENVPVESAITLVESLKQFAEEAAEAGKPVLVLIRM